MVFERATDKANEADPPADRHMLFLAGGCFWGLEAYLKRLPGVIETQVGYANGSTEYPSYRDVCQYNTGHAEAVAVAYDRTILPTATLLEAFFEAIDPTTVDRQGNDTGTQYRSVPTSRGMPPSTACSRRAMCARKRSGR